jgi:hypothetical protein
MDRGSDRGNDEGEVVEHGFVAKSKHPKSFVLERDRALRVSMGTEVVTITVELGHQAGARDVEVDDPASNDATRTNRTSRERIPSFVR